MKTKTKFKPSSCGIVIRCDNKVLLCRATKAWDDKGREIWGFPKGCQDNKSEAYARAACREVWEETGLEIGVSKIDFLMEYTSTSKLKWHYIFFITDVDYIDMDELSCSTIVDEKRNYPEIDKYEMVDLTRFKELVFNSQLELIKDPQVLEQIFGTQYYELTNNSR